MKPRSIKFIIEDGCRAPKEIYKEKTVYAVYSPEKTVINPGERIFIHTKFSVTYPNDILTTFIIMPKLQEEGLSNIQKIHNKKNMTIAIFMTLNEGNDSFKKKIEKIKTA